MHRLGNLAPEQFLFGLSEALRWLENSLGQPGADTPGGQFHALAQIRRLAIGLFRIFTHGLAAAKTLITNMTLHPLIGVVAILEIS